MNILEYILVDLQNTNHVSECLAVQFSSYMELKFIKMVKFTSHHQDDVFTGG